TRLKLCFDALECRNPTGREISEIARTEEALTPLEKPLFVFVPAEAFACTKNFSKFFFIFHTRPEHVIEAGQMHSSVILRESARLLRSHAVCIRCRIVLDIFAGGIGIEPFAHIAFIGFGAAGELGGADGRAIAHGAIEAETVPNENKCR